MADAKRDQNLVPTLIAVSNADGVTPVLLYADPVTHRLLISSSISGAGIAAMMQTDLFTTTASQTLLTISETALFIFAVVVNGQILTLTADYTFNGTTGITLVTSVPAGLNAHITYLHA